MGLNAAPTVILDFSRLTNGCVHKRVVEERRYRAVLL
jgi:hypothetical protein